MAEVDQSVFPEHTTVTLPDTSRRVVITGIGVVAPNGIGTETWWEATKKGQSGLGRIERFDPSQYATQIAGEVGDFEPADYIEKRLMVQTDRWTWMALAATQLAFDDAKFDPAEQDPWTMGVITASSSGGNEFGQNEIQNLWGKGPGFVGAYQSIAWFYAATTGQVSIRYGMRGPCGVLCTEQAGGLDALGQSRRLLGSGSRLVVSGGTDASLCPYGLVAQLSTGELSTVDDPTLAYLPFDANATGYVPGEGGAILVLENADGARRRGVPSYGTVAGYAAGFDPPPGSTRPPALARTIRAALADAGLTPDRVDVVFADATAVAARDLAEARAITEVFGPHGVPVTAPKTLTGRLYAGGAALDTATALLALRDGVLPPTAGVTRLAPGIDVDLVVEPREGRLSTALVLARGHGGFTAALVLTAGARTANY
jgi:act minimal PKS chain-length factor (CLF/KS beta)